MFPLMVMVWFAFFFLGYCAADSQAEVVVQGVVLDAETGKALPRANIEVVGQAWGTIGDGQGVFRLVVDALPVTLRATHIGYAPVELLVDEAGPLKFRLQPIPLELKGLIIDGDDPAVRIMREVIRRKRVWAPLAHRYRVEAHTRQVLYSNQYIAAIRESLAELYRDRDKGLREQLKAKKHTANVSASMQVFAAAKYLFNLYDDEIALHGQIFTGPTHPQALEHYSFQLVGHQDDHYFISIQPKTNALAGWTGALVVQDGEYALVEAQLWPNRRLHPAGFATENGLGYRLRQHFVRFAHGAWLPVETEYEIEGRVGT
ncbi:MAG: carboxypeptidase-like regulatory domain-containing protein, partial [Gemmatimonadetes bacterium]|nr:carboxypeptidase-like regulatory domain-containing protein [Gemmatimonadota bacterium]